MPHPRPQLTRPEWRSLDGPWDFAFDDGDVGVAEGWQVPGSAAFGRTIQVPFSPESELGGVADAGFHAVLWYRRTLRLDRPLDPDRRLLLHFGAVDHECRVWIDGSLVGEHVGGQTPFALDVTAAAGDGDEHVLVVRAIDDPADLEAPRGKQDWQERSHAIWYTRTSGIWQSVWLEPVPVVAVSDASWTTDLVAGEVRCEVAVDPRRAAGFQVEIVASLDGAAVGTAVAAVVDGVARIVLRPAALGAGQAREDLLWSPEHPVLFDALIRLRDARGRIVDEVASYFGIRTVGIGDGAFQLNGVPYFVRAVLEQGYWPQSQLTAPDDDARRNEVALIKELGFNTARVHQKVEDPRFLYWADRLGLMIWGESAAAYAYSPRAVELLAQEWPRIVARDRSHPSVVAWVPLNESWGVQDIARSSAQQQYARGLASLIRAIDPTRPVISNDGWEHMDSDLFTIHDYAADPGVLLERYGSRDLARASVDRPGPQGRPLSLLRETSDAVREGRLPVIISEFGGVSFAGDAGTWGYALVGSEGEFGERLRDLFGALNRSTGIAGYCYTQLSDTEQEANGLVTADRRPKLPVPFLREIVSGVIAGEHRFIWPPVTQ